MFSQKVEYFLKPTLQTVETYSVFILVNKNYLRPKKLLKFDNLKYRIREISKHIFCTIVRLLNPIIYETKLKNFRK